MNAGSIADFTKMRQRDLSVSGQYQLVASLTKYRVDFGGGGH
jgi:hypothetical protein